MNIIVRIFCRYMKNTCNCVGADSDEYFISGESGKMEKKYKRTLYASYFGYITQAIVNNLAPLLFVTFQKEYHISVAQIGFLVTYNFVVQMIVDILAAKYVERIGYKKSILAAHFFAAAGLIGMGFLPSIMSNSYAGLLLAITIYAVGGGLIEVLVSPIVQALPMDEKSAAMSLLHSFYCWGHVMVVVLSTVFFRVAGIENWRILTVLWALVPIFNFFLYAGAPIKVLVEEESAIPARKLFSMKLFWYFFILMICSGASEQAMSQWASYFAENGLHVSKTMGDLLGPCMFAVLMGLSRTFYGIMGDRIPLKKFISLSSVLCIFSYLAAIFAPNPVLSLAGCAICGLSVGIMWPGVFSLSAEYCPQGGTAMFAFLALAGDIGCSGGPSVVGGVSGMFEGNLKAGLLAAILFPLILIIGVNLLKKDHVMRCIIFALVFSGMAIHSVTPVEAGILDGQDVVNIMLIGQDKREGQDRQRSDTMILATINKEKNVLQLTSFMRDLYVEIPGYGEDRMNAAYQYGGMELLDEVMEKNFGIEIDGNVEVDFSGFQTCIDLLGGVELELSQEEADYICGRNQNVLYPQPLREDWNLTEGMNTLNGEQALIHARNRSIGNNDYRRTERQRDVLTAVLEKVKDAGIGTLLDLAEEGFSMFTTDMSYTEVLGYAMSVLKMDTDTIESYRIPQDGAYTSAVIRQMQVLVPDLAKCREYLQSVL